MMSRSALNAKIDNLFEGLKDSLISVFSNVDYVALTADIWSCKTRSFMGVTAHWIDPITLKRNSGIISCERFMFPHTNDRIAEPLQILCDSFGITEKVIATTTDNASNFLKSFREFGVSFDWHLDEQRELYENVEYSELEISLSLHVRCGSHTFSLIGVKDSADALNNNTYFKQHSSAFMKLNRIWKCSNQPKASEKIVEILGSAIHRPVAPRWNSVYDCVKKILAKDTTKMIELMKALEIQEFSSNEFLFLHEYVKVLKPIANAIDYLQAECNYASLLPIVHNTRQDLLQLKGEKLKFCQPLLTAVLKGMDQRFSYLFDFNDERCKPALIATCTHPYFKTRWLTGELRTNENLEKIRKTLITAASSIKMEAQAFRVSNETFNGNFQMDCNSVCFCLISQLQFLDTPKQTKSYPFRFDESQNSFMDRKIEAELDITNFLKKECANDEHDLTQLMQHLIVKELFKKFNAICTSSAAAERLFSQAGKY